MKNWIITAILIAGAVFLSKVLQMDGQGTAEAMVQGIGFIIFVSIIGLIFTLYKLIRAKLSKHS